MAEVGRVRPAAAGVRCLFDPAGIAVVGASPSNPVARNALLNAAAIGYEGLVGAVNPRYENVLDHPCVPSLTDLDFVPEAVIVSVGRQRVLPVLEEAAEIGVPAAVVFATGFADGNSADGADSQAALTELAADTGMAIVGPNCQGVINFAAPSALYLDDVRPYEPGAVGLIAQSGSISTALTNNARGVRWRYVASSGNEATVTAGDLLGWMVDDEECRLACLFLETIRDAPHFFAECDRARERELPVVIMKAGRSEAGQRAAQAHSGALAVPERLLDARFERHGVIRVGSLEELLETAVAMQLPVRPRGRNLATITASGGQIELALDGAADLGLNHADLAAETIDEIARILPPELTAENPLDYYGVDDEELAYPRLMGALAADEAVDVVLAMVDQSTSPTGDGRYQLPYDSALGLAARHPDKPIVLIDAIGGGSPAKRVEEALARGVGLLSGVDSAMRAIANVVRHSEWLETSREPATDALPIAPEVREAVQRRDHAFSGLPALELLAKAGVPMVETLAVATAAEAAEAAERLGYPVVLKLADERLTHKTEVGGVIAGIDDLESLELGVRGMLAEGHRELLVQRQAEPAVEMLLGVTRHRELGSFVLVGLGGIWAELFDDIVLAPVGLASGEARSMVGRLQGHRILEGARGTAPVDIEGLITAIEGIDRFALALGEELDALDVNPFFVGSEGCLMVDAVVVPRASSA